MSAEKIAALKAKRIAHKRETIKDDTITEIVNDQSLYILTSLLLY